MKQYFLSIITALSLFISCTKSNNNNGGGGNSLTNTPEANAAYDNSGFGIYKGVFVGSTGYIVININNVDNTINAKVVIDGVAYTFTPNNSNITQGTPISVTFINEIGSFNFSVGADGSNPTISSVNVSGHSGATIVIIKERSNSLVKCMEGTFTGDARGIWNAVVNDNVFRGIYFDVVNDNGGLINGNVTSSNNVSGTASGGVIFSGNLAGNNGNGNWSVPEEDARGTWKVTRTY